MKTFTAAAIEFFGLHPGQTKMQFGLELKALTISDKLELAAGMRKAGVECEDPIGAK